MDGRALAWQCDGGDAGHVAHGGPGGPLGLGVEVCFGAHGGEVPDWWWVEGDGGGEQYVDVPGAE